MVTKKPRLTVRVTYEGDDNWQNHIHVQRVMNWDDIGRAVFNLPVEEFKLMLRQLTAAVEAGEENE